MDALMPFGLSCLSRTDSPHCLNDWSAAVPRRFQYVQPPLGEIATPLYKGNGEDEEKNKFIRIATPMPPRYRRRYHNDEDGEENKQPTDEESPGVIYYSPKADMIRCDTTGALEPRAGLWQEVAPWWDRVQIRFNQCSSYEVERRGALPQCSIERPGKVQRKPDITIEYKPIIDPLMKKEVRFYRTVPGYCGYVPRYPVPPRPQEHCPNPALTSISKTTYKLFPSYEYKKQKFAHKGPLSSTVTTTPPFNPFNKIDLLSLNGQKLLWKRKNHSNTKKVPQKRSHCKY